MARVLISATAWEALGFKSKSVLHLSLMAPLHR